ncbi:choice-of-anchor J domain-containing protein [Hymenobacter sp. BT507]|uniref:Choice-of-anchor J domain-containing protein n=1 Tax=Hymenobacter citatus TaxID=2763506 RepID=A0ABR7MG93_9BACT|nr:choice-of-anchor J domain-containing protein [Hymenobacter citatus]MBC6610080.1 choice-of-anchor J domain-containing protein [Hymenobacter citatus]
MKHFLLRMRSAATALALLCSIGSAAAQVTLSGSSYTENFDQIGTGLPAGFSVRTAAKADALGSVATLTTTPTEWNNTSGAFKNFASATGLTAAADPTAQNASTNRALGVRQTGSFADGSANAGPAFVFQLANTSARTGFKLNFLLQSLDASSTRTTTWRVDYATGATPTTFTQAGTATFTTGNSTFSSTPVSIDFGNQLDNINDVVWIRIVAPSATTGSNTRASSAIDDFSLTWTATAPDAPTLTVLPNGIGFGRINLAATSTVVGYALTGANLTDATTVTAPAGFSVSKTATGTFGSTLTYTVAELATPQTVYVRFVPTAAGFVSGTITNSTAGATDKTVAVSGTGVDPNNNLFAFDECPASATSFDGWTQFSITGDQTWGCTTFGHNAADASGTASAPNGVQINGYSGSARENEDWFISPAFDLSNFQNPLFSFWSRVAFTGPGLSLRVSTNYSGTGSPSAAGVTWTTLPVPFASADAWMLTDNVDLSAYKGSNVHVAFVYTSTTSAAARWTLDDIRLQNSSTPAQVLLSASTSRLDFGYQMVGAATAATRTFALSARNLTGPVTITSQSPVFQVSKDGTAFSNTVSYTAAEANTATVTVRFAPAQAAASYSTPLSVATTGADSRTVMLYGNSVDPAVTLDVVNWNIEWFGSSAQNPADDNLQQANALATLSALNADVIALAEIVDTVRLGTVVRQMPGGYRYKVSEYVSGNTFGTAQKLAFVYRTSVVANPTFSNPLQCTSCDQYNYWASGRFPYLMTANVTMNGQTKPVTFIVIHAKANESDAAGSLESYNRRVGGATGLKALLDADYATANVVILGDYNDDLYRTIATGTPTTASSYSVFLNDAANYQALTLPLAVAGQRSTVDYSSVIDNVIVSSEMAAYYVSNSVQIRSDVAAQVADFGNTTSDHYPVLTRFSFAQATLPTKQATASKQFDVYPNPVTSAVRLSLPEPTSKTLHLRVSSVDGRQVATGTGSLEQLNQQLNQNLTQLKAGMYIIQVDGGTQTYVKRFIKQ